MGERRGLEPCLAGFTGIGLLFPTGIMPRGRWGVIAWMLVLAFVPLALANSFGPTIGIKLSGYAGTVSIPNPAGWAAARRRRGVLAVRRPVRACPWSRRSRCSRGSGSPPASSAFNTGGSSTRSSIVVVGTLFWVLMVFG